MLLVDQAKQHPQYHAGITRDEVKRTLESAQLGHFILRFSTSTQELVLSMKSRTRVLHHIITVDAQDTVCFNNVKMAGCSTLEDALHCLMDEVQSQDFVHVPLITDNNDIGLEKYDWYHGSIARPEAEKRLKAAGSAPGTFLVRHRQAQSYALSVVGGFGKMTHHRLDFDEGGTVLLNDAALDPTCSRLEDVIDLLRASPQGAVNLVLERTPSR